MIRAEFLFFGLSLWAMTGRSPNRNIAQGNTLGVSQLSNLRSERAAGGSSLAILPIPFALSERKIATQFLPRVLPWAVFPLGFQPVIAHNHDCCTIICSIFLLVFYSAISCNYGCCTVLWTIFLFCFQPVISCNHSFYTILCALFLFGFQPVFAVTKVAPQFPGLYFCSAFSPSFLVTMAAAQSSTLYYFWAFSSPLYSVWWFVKNSI